MLFSCDRLFYQGADRAIAALNGRFFAGRIVRADKYDQYLYDHGDLSG